MKALIMAGGEGTRLRPLTCNRPKPMVPVMNKPVMEHIINLLKKNNITDIGVTLQYMPQIIQDYFEDGSGFGVNIHYFIEDTPLGTAGSVKNAEDFLDDTFMVIRGDALTDIDLKKVIDYHDEKKAMATLVLTRVDKPLEYGVVVTDADGRITRFLEKPSWSEVFSDTVNTGIYILQPEVLDYFEKGEMFDFSKDLFPLLLKKDKPLFGYVTSDYWCDIGDLAAYQQCHFDILDGKVNIQIDAEQIDKGIWVEKGVNIEEGAIINGPVLIGANTTIKKNAEISSYVVIGSDNIIHENASLKKSIIWKGNIIGKGAQLRGCTLCSKVQVKEHSSIFEQSVVGDETIIEERVVIKPSIKIWPSKIIESWTEVNVNLVWGGKYSKTLFGEKGVAGEINVDITPEFASRLGASFGILLKKDAKVGVSCDQSNASHMLKNSFISGLLSAGAEVYDFGEQILPVTRFATSFFGLDGAIHLDTASSDNDSKLSIDFIDSRGININRATERKLENIFIREDFCRCEADDVKKVKEIKDFTPYYLRNIINNLENKKLGYKLCIDAPSKALKSIMVSLMEELECELNMLEVPMANRESLSKLVLSTGSDLGAVISSNCERLMLIDEKGRFVDDEMFTALTSLIVLSRVKNATVVVPISAPSVIDRMAEKYGGKVIRTKTSPLEIMSKMVADGQKKTFLSDQFTLNFDALGSIIKIMDYMKSNSIKLSQLVDEIPSFHMIKKEVECPWNAKGKVIRKIIEESYNEKMELMEGVKIYKDGGWVLVLPDSEKPVCKVIGEGYSQEFAESLTDTFANRVKEIGMSG
ncbi:MAG: NTP transferase domain-containing protein [Clostridiaceae bacterium]|nr:NTP transferase domain-containing protein [Clostridiaceae bacterium]